MSSSTRKPSTKFDKIYIVDASSGNIDVHESAAASGNAFTSPQRSVFQHHHQNNNNIHHHDSGSRTPPPPPPSSTFFQTSNENNNNTSTNYYYPVYNFGTTTTTTTNSVLKFSSPSSFNTINNHNNHNNNLLGNSPVAVINSLRNNNNNNNNIVTSSSSSIPIGSTKTSGLRALPNRHHHHQQNNTSSGNIDSLISFVNASTGSIALNSLRGELTKNADTFLSPISWAESLLDRVHHDTEQLNLTRPDCITSGSALIILELISKKLSSSSSTSSAASPYAPLLEKIHKLLEGAVFQKKSYDDNTAYFDLYRASLRTRLVEIRRPQNAVAKAFLRCNLNTKRAVFVAWRGLVRRKRNAVTAAMQRADWKKRKIARQLLSSHFFAWKHYMGLRCRVLTSDEAKTKLVFRLARYTKQLEKDLQSCQAFCSQLISDNQMSFERVSASMEKWDEFKNWWMLFDVDENTNNTLTIENNSNNNHNNQNALQITNNENQNGVSSSNCNEEKNKESSKVKFLLNNGNEQEKNKTSGGGAVIVFADTQNNNNNNDNDNDETQKLLLLHQKEVEDLEKEDESLRVIQQALQEATRLNDEKDAEEKENQRQITITDKPTTTTSPALSLQYLENQLNKIDQSISEQDHFKKINNDEDDLDDAKKKKRTPAQQEIRHANALKLAAEKHQKDLQTKFLQNNPTYNKELLDWVSSRIQCVSLSLDLSLKQHQFTVAGTTNSTSAFASSGASSISTVPAVLVGKQICSNFTSDFQGSAGLEKLSRLAVSLGAPKKLLLPASSFDDDHGHDDENLRKTANDKNKNNNFANKLEIVCQELNDLVLIHHQNKNDDDKKNPNSITLLQPSDVTSMKGRKISIFLHGLYQIYKSVPVHVIPQRISSTTSNKNNKHENSSSLKLVSVKRNDTEQGGEEEEDPLALLERHLQNSALAENDSSHQQDDPDFEGIINDKSRQPQQQQPPQQLPTQSERDELTKWYLELAADDSDDDDDGDGGIDPEIVEEVIAANVDNHLFQENDENNNSSASSSKALSLYVGNNFRHARERRRARARALGIPSTKEIIERTLKRSQNVLSDEWKNVMVITGDDDHDGKNDKKKKTDDENNNNSIQDPVMENNNNNNNNNTMRKNGNQKFSSSTSLPVSSTVRQQALLKHRLGNSHRQMVEWIEDAVDAVVLEKELSSSSKQNNNNHNNRGHLRSPQNHHHLLPNHQYLHNVDEKKHRMLINKKAQTQQQQDDDENGNKVLEYQHQYVFENENISNLEMLESVLKTATRSSSSTQKIGGINNNDDENENNLDEARKRRLQLFQVEKMLHDDVKLKNVKLRSAVGVTKNDTIISMRQLMTALYVLKGGKDFVVVV